MLRNWLHPLLAVWLALPAALSAQETPAPPPRPRREPRPENRVYSFGLIDNRGRIGVVVNTVANPETDKYGAKIEGITPGGPAEKAGLKAGDVISKFNGTSLAGAATEDQDDSGPGMKLLKLARALDPGDTVRIEYRRGAETKSATLVAVDLGGGFAWNGNLPEQPRISVLEAPWTFKDAPDFSFCFGETWCDLDLVTLNPDLGEYFGARDGILVVKAPADSTLPLKSGDVILSIGGRKPTSPAHAMRILRSYEAGETVAVEIQRHQRRLTLSWKVPEMNEHHWRRMLPGRSHERERGEPSFWRVPRIEPPAKVRVGQV